MTESDAPKMDFKAQLTRKVGPLPVWGWGLAVGGGLLAASYMRARAGGGGGAEDPGVAPATATAAGVGNLGDTGTATVTPAVTPYRATNNDEWRTLASELILGTHLGYSGLAVDTALSKYLSGEPLSIAEQAIVNLAIRLAGSPPTAPPLPIPGTPVDDTPNTPNTPQNPVDTGTTPNTPNAPTPAPAPTPYKPPSYSFIPAPKPPPKPAPKPTPKPVPKPPAKAKTKVITYTVKRGDTLSSIAAKHHTTVDAIWTYNTTGGHRPADTVATIKKRGKNTMYAGSTWLIVVPV